MLLNCELQTTLGLRFVVRRMVLVKRLPTPPGLTAIEIAAL